MSNPYPQLTARDMITLRDILIEGQAIRDAATQQHILDYIDDTLHHKLSAELQPNAVTRSRAYDLIEQCNGRSGGMEALFEAVLAFENDPPTQARVERFQEWFALGGLLEQGGLALGVLRAAYEVLPASNTRALPGSEWTVLSYLQPFRPGVKAGESALLPAFVIRVAQRAPEALRDRLLGWVDVHGEDWGWAAAEKAALVAPAAPPPSGAAASAPSLIVQVRIEAATDGVGYLVAAWYREAGKEAVHFYDGEVDDKANLSQLVTQAMWNELRQRVVMDDVDPLVEFFLDDDLLLSEDAKDAIDQWGLIFTHAPPLPLGFRAPVVVRYLQRLRPKYQDSRREWRRCWDQFRARQSLEVHESETAGNVWQYEYRILAAPLKSSSLQEFRNMMALGIPVALWPRQACGEREAVMEELRELVSKQPAELLWRTVWDKRRADWRQDRQQNPSRLGYHLTLLWDDPDRVPPDEVQPDQATAGRPLLFRPPQVRGG